MTGQRITGGNKRALQVQEDHPRIFTAERRKNFLDTLAATCNVRLSARVADVGLTSCYRLRAKDPGFAEAWRIALAMGYDRLEEALLEYAVSRVEAANVDPGAVDPATVDGSFAQSVANGSVTSGDLHFAVGLLNRHRATIAGKESAGRNGHRATRAETDAVLRRKLDSLAKRTGER